MTWDEDPQTGAETSPHSRFRVLRPCSPVASVQRVASIGPPQ